MITKMQKTLLQQAAARTKYSEGSIAAIFAVAMVFGDDETCDYIFDNYLTLDHFDTEDIEFFTMVKADMAIGEPVGNA